MVGGQHGQPLAKERIKLGDVFSRGDIDPLAGRQPPGDDLRAGGQMNDQIRWRLVRAYQFVEVFAQVKFSIGQLRASVEEAGEAVKIHLQTTVH